MKSIFQMESGFHFFPYEYLENTECMYSNQNKHSRTTGKKIYSQIDGFLKRNALKKKNPENENHRLNNNLVALSETISKS